MKIEKQVCSLELAKKLKSLGVNHKSLFYWCNMKMLRAGEPTIEVPWHVIYGSQGWVDSHLVPAYTVADLGEILPERFLKETEGNFKEVNAHTLNIHKLRGNLNWAVGYRDSVFMTSENEADARAQMLIYLLENNLI